ncbi:MAG: aminotransferase class III-fold pyridoxal phosphate-dependent enzyme [Sandaracinaceae bacterium]|nr:aminotransferase class III-fold pyridoxal phosphate-dependent enzyme [Sandaracinaceae bacterium]
MAGPGFGKVFFTLGGAEANENAIKIARMVTGRYKVLSRYRSYHGASMGALSLTGDYRRPPLEPAMVGAVKALDCYCDRCPFGKEVSSCARECATSLGDVLALEGNVGAVFLEPVPGANGVLVPAGRLLAEGPRRVRRERRAPRRRRGALWLRAHGTLARAPALGATPDLITVSKGLTGGYGVLGAVIVHERVARFFDEHTLLAGLTHYAHPLGIAAALEALAVYEDEGLVERAEALGPRLLSMLESVRARHACVRFTRGLGLLAALELELDDAALARLGQALSRRRVHAHLRKRERTLVLAPPLCIAEEDLALGARLVEEAIAEAAAG